MPYHYRLCACVYAVLVRLSVRLIPFVAGHSIHGGEQVLISLVNAVAREVLYGSRQSVPLHFFYVGLAKLRNISGFEPNVRVLVIGLWKL